jgi:hypothetical protein
MYLARKEDSKETQVYRLADDVVISGKVVKCHYDQYLIEGWRWKPKRLERYGSSGREKFEWREIIIGNLCGSGWSAVAKTPEIARFKVEVLARGEA